MALTKVVYAPASQVQSANLNNIQDEIIADELRITALEATTQSVVVVHSSAIAGAVNCAYVNALSGYWNVTAAPGEIRVPITDIVGADIDAWSVEIRDTASIITAQLFRALPGAAPIAIGVAQNSAGNTTDQTLSHTLATSETISSGAFYWVRVTMSAISMRLYGAHYTRTA